MRLIAVPGDTWLMSSTRTKATDDGAENPAASAALDFDAVYREHRGTLSAVVRSVIGPSDELEDVLQHVFIEVHRALPRFEGRSRLSTWLYRIAVNVSIQHVRKKRRTRWLVLGSAVEGEVREPVGQDARARVEDRELLRQVERSVAKLTEKKRVVWQLHELQGLEPQEIADILDIPMNTVRSRLLAARHEVLEDLEKRRILPSRGTP